MVESSAVLEVRPEVEAVNTGIDAKHRREIAEHLSQILTDTYLLVVKSHIYHWNVVGPLFNPLHELTEDHYQNLFEAADDLAERIRALGHLAPVKGEGVLSDGAIKIKPGGTEARVMIEDLIDDHEALTRRMREGAALAEGHGDFATHDLLTERLTYHEKAIWMLRAIAAR